MFGRTAYPLTLVELEPHEEVGFDGYVIGAFPVKHRVEAYGYAFVEDDRPGRFDADAARRLGVEEGPDFGRLQRGETVGGVTPDQVVGDTRPGRRIVLSGDTAPCQAVEVHAHGADVLVHEATFLADERARARQTFHSTAGQAAELARDAGVRLLALTHLSTRYFPRDIAPRREPSSPTPSCRATSTPSRSRSRSGARRRWSRRSASRRQQAPDQRRRLARAIARCVSRTVRQLAA